MILFAGFQIRSCAGHKTVFLTAVFVTMLASTGMLIADSTIDTALQNKLQTALKARGKDYRPRTEHLNPDGSPVYTNRLILEQSPYLIQHAHNPVNWYAWGPEAFERAQKENKPVFLSIGYSTCHWCHVMERESFDNEALADYLNKHYIAIKVDRERRPDVDKSYMTAAMLLNGSGGWPLSAILTPEGRPFFLATYMPRETFLDVLKRAEQLWQHDETRLRQMADKISAAVKGRQQSILQAEHIGKERVQIAVINLLNRFDDLQGGFSQAPKFPNESYLFLLLDTAIRELDKEVYNALRLTLDRMAQGGIYDQIGGGFHRYSTDNDWLVPHFEKMLYNQALLSMVYLQMYDISRQQNDRRIVTQTLDYVLRDMHSKQGAFYSASDADSNGREGQYFLWTQAELKKYLPDNLYKLAVSLYVVTAEGNFSEPAAGGGLNTRSQGETILHLPHSIEAYARQHHLPSQKVYQDVDRIRAILLKQRQSRIAPAIDKKVITAWNGMMITALAKAGAQLEQPRYLQAARKAAEFLWQTHYRNGKLWRASLDAKPSVMATQADYAWLAQAFLSLYDETAAAQWLSRARELTQKMVQLFWDKESGNFYLSASRPEDPTANRPSSEVALFNRPKDLYDGAIPSANAVALDVLTQLYYRTGDDYYQGKAMALVASVSGLIKTAPTAFAYFLGAVDKLNYGELACSDKGAVLYAAKGHMRIQPQLNRRIKSDHKTLLELQFKVIMDKNWHINSHYPLDEDLQPTTITLDKRVKARWKLAQVGYPEGEQLKLKFSDKPLSLYQKQVIINVKLESVALLTKQQAQTQPKARTKTAASDNISAEDKLLDLIPVQLHYQTCNDKICLAPEMQSFYFAP